jgi:hypothetical protein
MAGMHDPVRKGPVTNRFGQDRREQAIRHKDIKELTQVPLTDFWNRWRHKLPQPERQESAPTLREAEKRRRGVTRQAAKELAAIVTMPPRAAKPADSNTG